jgi:hypothetical protein
MSTQFHAPGQQATSRPDRARTATATTTPVRRPTRPAGAGRTIGVGVDAPKLWAGGAASALISGLVALVGVLVNLAIGIAVGTLVGGVAARSIP